MTKKRHKVIRIEVEGDRIVVETDDGTMMPLETLVDTVGAPTAIALMTSGMARLERVRRLAGVEDDAV